ncbi:helix-turn-helix transcriptional regulator [Winogradskyella sp.]|uniref:helix-turn-helix domain-containing protein n=1 Tax=Winogradskyella sp. TaxID=1883156 RepID=UPI0026171F3C|nr:helix-turn-helix transcriptional regulator [Winogradskyella sp.]
MHFTLNYFKGIFLILVLVLNAKIFSQEKVHAISGLLELGPSWRPTVYLSHIKSFDDLYTISNEMIIAESKIDSLGRFSIPTNYLIEQDQLYRIHISKKSDPEASLIIGGSEENHIFIIANRNSDIEIVSLGKEKLLNLIEIKEHLPSQSLLKIDKIYHYKDSTDYGLSTLKKEFVVKAINEKLRFVADTSKHPLVSLYALHKSDFKSNYSLNKAFYTNYLDKWSEEDSNYFKVFKNQLPTKKTKNYQPYLVGVLSFVLGFLTHFLVKENKARARRRLKSLSVQERKILGLLQQGKSNKEISEEYHIEINTVKTHIRNIYSKLNIKSRKEALEIKSDNLDLKR